MLSWGVSAGVSVMAVAPGEIVTGLEMWTPSKAMSSVAWMGWVVELLSGTAMVCGFRSLALFGYLVHLHQHPLAIRGVVERLCCLWRIRIAVCIFLIQTCLHLRTLWQPLPIAAQFVVDQVVRRQRCKFTARI